MLTSRRLLHGSTHNCVKTIKLQFVAPFDTLQQASTSVSGQQSSENTAVDMLALCSPSAACNPMLGKRQHRIAERAAINCQVR